MAGRRGQVETAGESGVGNDQKTVVGGRSVRTCVAAASLFVQRSDKDFTGQLLLECAKDGYAAGRSGERTGDVGCWRDNTRKREVKKKR